jgi:hypothetical protein
MADTRLLTNQVEEYVRTELARQFGRRFEKKALVLSQRSDGSDATHEFDAVSEDGRIVAAIKSSSGKTSGGRLPSGKIAAAYKDLYFLSLARAERRFLVLTDPEFHAIFIGNCDGKLAAGIEVLLIPLPADLKEQVQAVHRGASKEMSGGL